VGSVVRLCVLICILIVHTAIPVSVLANSQPGSIIGAVVFEGVTVFGPEQLSLVYEPVVGRTLQPKTNASLSTRTQALYRDSGFLEPAVTVSAHPSVAGVVKVTVIEPELSHIELTNASAQEASLINRSLAPLKQRRPMSRSLIERTLRSLSQVHNIDLTYDLASGPQAGFRLILTLRPQIEGAIAYSSEGDRRLGRHLVFGQISVSNPMSHVKSLGINGLHTLNSDGYRVGGGNVEFAITPRNSLLLKAKVGRAILEPDTGGPDTVYRFRQYQSRWSYMLIPGTRQNAELYGSLIAREFTRTTQGVHELDEHLRMLDVGVQTLTPGSNRVHRIKLSGRFGFDALGASRNGTQAGDIVDPSFQIVRSEYTLWQGLPAGLLLRADIEGQYSPDNVPSSQRFTIGGSRFSRAYEPGEFAGDSGLGGNVEFRRQFNGGPWLPSRLTPFIYYSLAAIHENNTSDRESAAAAGIGLRISGDGYSGFLEYGKPLTVSSRYKDNEARMNGRLTIYF
tara:strand:+ start:7213 stop:8739 length:1527 start_codon:yes stop_codon:yes gene_type:complete